MCTSAYINGAEVESVGELRAALGVVVPIELDGVPVELRDEECLCSVSMERTFLRAGVMSYWHDEELDVWESPAPKRKRRRATS